MYYTQKYLLEQESKTSTENSALQKPDYSKEEKGSVASFDLKTSLICCGIHTKKRNCTNGHSAEFPKRGGEIPKK